MHWGVTLTRHVHGEKANVTEEMNVELYRGLLEEKRTGKIRHVGAARPAFCEQKRVAAQNEGF